MALIDSSVTPAVRAPRQLSPAFGLPAASENPGQTLGPSYLDLSSRQSDPNAAGWGVEWTIGKRAARQEDKATPHSSLDNGRAKLLSATLFAWNSDHVGQI